MVFRTWIFSLDLSSGLRRHKDFEKIRNIKGIDMLPLLVSSMKYLDYIVNLLFYLDFPLVSRTLCNYHPVVIQSLFLVSVSSHKLRVHILSLFVTLKHWLNYPLHLISISQFEWRSKGRIRCLAVIGFISLPPNIPYYYLRQTLDKSNSIDTL